MTPTCLDWVCTTWSPCRGTRRWRTRGTRSGSQWSRTRSPLQVENNDHGNIRLCKWKIFRTINVWIVLEEPNVGRPEEHVQEANDHGHVRLCKWKIFSRKHSPLQVENNDHGNIRLCKLKIFSRKHSPLQVENNDHGNIRLCKWKIMITDTFASASGKYSWRSRIHSPLQAENIDENQLINCIAAGLCTGTRTQRHFPLSSSTYLSNLGPPPLISWENTKDKVLSPKCHSKCHGEEEYFTERQENEI